MVADKKKCQTLINTVAKEVVELKRISDTLSKCRQLYQDQNVNPQGTPLEGHVADISDWIDVVNATANNAVANGFLDHVVPSHRNKALGEQ